MVDAKKRNIGLDALRFIASLLVIVQHTFATDKLGVALSVNIAMVAVPIFFMISGLYLRERNIKANVIKLLKIGVSAQILYLFMYFVFAVIQGKTAVFINNLFSQQSIINFCVFNDPYYGDHLWYLFAAAYATLVVGALLKRKRILFFLTLICFIFLFVLGKYSFLFFHSQFSSAIRRNWYGLGIPFIGVGHLLKEKIENFRTRYLLSVDAILFVLCIVEFLLFKDTINAGPGYYFSNCFFSVALFITVYNIKEGRAIDYLAKLGKKYSLSIYIIHPLFRDILDKVNETVHLFDISIYNYIMRPVLTSVMAIAFSILLYKMKKIGTKKRKTA